MAYYEDWLSLVAHLTSVFASYQKTAMLLFTVTFL